MAHNEPEVLKILLSLLDDNRNNIYIHIDERSEILNEDIIMDWCKKSKITFIEREKVYWAGYSQIKASMALLKIAVEEKHSYYHFISGVDLPLKTQDELHQFFSENQGQEFVSFGKIASWKLVSRYKYYYPEKITNYINRKVYRIVRLLLAGLQSVFGIDRTKKTNLEYHMGGNWFSITHDFGSYILEKGDLIKKLFSNTFCTDEIFLPTLLMNSPFRDNVSPMMNLRYVDWNRGKPYTWQINDFMELTKNNHFFARKFSYEKYPEIIEKIRDHLNTNNLYSE
jgi:hypothetical protein